MIRGDDQLEEFTPISLRNMVAFPMSVRHTAAIAVALVLSTSASAQNSAPPAVAPGEGQALARAVSAAKSGDLGTTLSIYRDLADHGSAVGMTRLGLMYQQGIGVSADPERACDLYAQAEVAADPDGTKLLGDCFFTVVGGH
jgi:TPR repeat protein